MAFDARQGEGGDAVHAMCGQSCGLGLWHRTVFSLFPGVPPPWFLVAMYLSWNVGLDLMTPNFICDVQVTPSPMDNSTPPSHKYYRWQLTPLPVLRSVLIYLGLVFTTPLLAPPPLPSSQDASGNFRRLAGNTTVPRAQTAPAGSEATRRPALTPQLHSLSLGPSGTGAAAGFSYAHSGSAAAAAAAAAANTNGSTPSMLGGGLGTPHSSLAPPGAGGGGGPLPGQRIVVLVADNDSTGLAVKLLMAMVKPGRDVVILVHVVRAFRGCSQGGVRVCWGGGGESRRCLVET